MKLYLDSAKIDEIRYALDAWDIDGVTTNPNKIRDGGKPFLPTLRALAKELEGEDRPIFVQVNPHHGDAEAMVAEAIDLANMSDSLVIKIPATEPGFRALQMLTEKDIRVCITLVFTALQALLAGRLGAAYVAPYISSKGSGGEETSQIQMIQEIRTLYNNYGFDTEILVAAVRNPRQILEAALYGADGLTASFAVLKEAFAHPNTDAGLKRFIESWDAVPYGAE
jgi:transaldolase